jgi:hypothetical protein
MDVSSFVFRTPWRDGTRAVMLTPEALVARRRAMVPSPRFHLTRYAPSMASNASATTEACFFPNVSGGRAGGDLRAQGLRAAPRDHGRASASRELERSLLETDAERSRLPRATTAKVAEALGGPEGAPLRDDHAVQGRVVRRASVDAVAARG